MNPSIFRRSEAFTTLSDLIDVATKEFSTQEELDKLLEFQSKYRDDLGTAETALEQSIERTETNMAWREAHYDDIVDWLVRLELYIFNI